MVAALADPPEPRWISRREAAKRTGLHYNTIRKWHEVLHLFAPREVQRRKRGSDGWEWFYDISAVDRIAAERHTPVRFTEGETRERVAALEAENAELRQQLMKSETERRDLMARVMDLAHRNSELTELAIGALQRAQDDSPE